MNTHQKDDDMRITTSTDVLLGLQDRIAELEAQLEAVGAGGVGAMVLPGDLQSVSDDARRYQLLRRGQQWSVIDGIGETLRAEQLDAAVDAAIAATQSGVKGGA